MSHITNYTQYGYRQLSEMLKQSILWWISSKLITHKGTWKEYYHENNIIIKSYHINITDHLGTRKWLKTTDVEHMH